MLLSVTVAVTAAASTGCAGAGGQGDTPGRGTGAGPGDTRGQEAHPTFDARAEQVAKAWRTTPGTQAWEKDFMPLQALTVPGEGVRFADATRRAFTAGWYRLATGMPRETGGRTGTIRYPDGGTATVPLVTRAEAYGVLDQGDPPPCDGAVVPPPADGSRAGGGTENRGTGNAAPASGQPPKGCVALTITGVTLGDVELLTSRGRARVPAWLFNIRELNGAVARVAVAPSAIAQVPEAKVGQPSPAPDLVSAQDLISVADDKVSYRLGVGACDENITPLRWESDDAVVVAGTVVRSDKICTEQLLLHPVTVDLDEPLDTRPVLDAVTGRVLTVPAVPIG